MAKEHNPESTLDDYLTAQHKIARLEAKVEELKGLALDVWEWRDRATVQNQPAAAALMRERFRKHGLLEEECEPSFVEGNVSVARDGGGDGDPARRR